ncbi:hypothetical protein Pyn_20887 [Prunus yedoensis var. nudiflora]|uniref:Uncharacterized protein n=1 Tax=Prunus yedoensis var. nudiflora TaxID=2094558 RepID=A0A314Y646_PRUYE|nr:hypothetical protein Pyn_20887 [Prunus yedoensis var. nudiflora]
MLIGNPLTPKGTKVKKVSAGPPRPSTAAVAAPRVTVPPLRWSNGRDFDYDSNLICGPGSQGSACGGGAKDTGA